MFNPATNHTKTRWHSLAERTQNVENMIKRNLGLILVIIAMVLNILNFGFSNMSTKPLSFWLFLGSIFVLIAAFIKILITENKENKKSRSD